MNFHRLTYHLLEEQHITVDGTLRVKARTEWFPSNRDAVTRRLALFNSGRLIGKKSDHPIDLVEVPTDKAGLLDWLRKECV